MKSKWKNDLIAGIVIDACFLIYFVQTFKIRQTTLIKLTSTFIPRICVVFGLLLGTIMIIQALADRKKALLESDEELTAEQKEDKKAKLIAALLAFAILFVGIFMIEKLGFVWGSMFYLFASMFICTKFIEKNWIVIAIITVIVPILIYLAFAKGFSLRLPAGFLGLLGGIL